MKSPTIKILAVLSCMALSLAAKAQIVSTNPLEYVALAEGNEVILSKVRDQIDGQKKTALLQNTIAAEFEQMRQWEKKYNSYLKTASGFASSIKACTHLYNDGVKIFISLGKLKKAIGDNPQGIVVNPAKRNGPSYKNETVQIMQKRNVYKKAVSMALQTSQTHRFSFP